ncbi:hypothetical protein [Dasineura jujubifolia toursvirus 2a]|nr:hypothetical protein [Dasineura jujubifolia toursvirus 2a]
MNNKEKWQDAKYILAKDGFNINTGKPFTGCNKSYTPRDNTNNERKCKNKPRVCQSCSECK